MTKAKHETKVTYGGWYQRTTLHLSEVYELLMHGTSHLNLEKDQLLQFKKGLDLKQVTRESGSFEFVKAITNSGIELRYYEDGLYVLELVTEDIIGGQKILEEYFLEKFNPAIAYIFSIGAPTPKVLANIKTDHPCVVSVFTDKVHPFTLDQAQFGEIYTTISSNSITVLKTPKYIFIVAPKSSGQFLTDLIEMQIFFREFKDQLEKYLHIHRTIWEEISEVKEAKLIKGKSVDAIRGRLDGYQKTINLISNRINQMGSYVNTRSSIAKHLEIEGELISLFEYKFETLSDTLNYIKEIWKMTSDYLSSAISNLVEIKNQTTSNNLKSLQTITSIGVISGVLGYLSLTKVPTISRPGIIYFIVLFCLTWFLNFVIVKRYENKNYSLKFGDRIANL